MSQDHWVAVFSALVSFTGLLLVAIQMRQTTKERRGESLNKIYDVNRQLISLGFNHPQLFNILTDAKNVDPEWERRYLQLWLNQLSSIHTHLQYGGFAPEFQDSLVRQITEFMTLQNMQRHWKGNGEFYPASFQQLVDGILSKLPAPQAAPRGS